MFCQSLEQVDQRVGRLMDEVMWELPVRSQEFDRGPEFVVTSRCVVMRWDYEGDEGDYLWMSASFVGVENCEFTAHDSCSPEQVRAYDRLVKIEPSDRLDSLRGAGSKFLQHFRIFFDEIGCLDVIAEDFKPPAA